MLLLDEGFAFAAHERSFSEMKRRHSVSQALLVKLGCCLFLSLALAACQNSANVSRSDNRTRSPTSESQDNGTTSQQTSDDGSATTTEQTGGGLAGQICRKYDACGCQKYDDCMAQIGNDPSIDQPGIGDCMLKSSCQSLCAGHPDGCPRTNAGNSGSAPQRTNCAAIPCSSNSDCPTDCYGGCGDSRVCLTF
jgi:hypothetical protein